MSEQTLSTDEVREAAYEHGCTGVSYEDFDQWLNQVKLEAAARARGEALVEVVHAHRILHKTYGSTSTCRGGIGRRVLTAHCAEICYNADAHEKELEAWWRLEGEAVEYSRATKIREGTVVTNRKTGVDMVTEIYGITDEEIRGLQERMRDLIVEEKTARVVEKVAAGFSALSRALLGFGQSAEQAAEQSPEGPKKEGSNE